MVGIVTLIRHKNGNIIIVLAANIRIATNALAELWAIRDGLIMA